MFALYIFAIYISTFDQNNTKLLYRKCIFSHVFQKMIQPFNLNLKQDFISKITEK